jgi:hypothetical protein
LSHELPFNIPWTITHAISTILRDGHGILPPTAIVYRLIDLSCVKCHVRPGYPPEPAIAVTIMFGFYCFECLSFRVKMKQTVMSCLPVWMLLSLSTGIQSGLVVFTILVFLSASAHSASLRGQLTLNIGQLSEETRQFVS